jgi:hypothetical protein
MKLERIGLIGYGEVGKIFCAGLLKQPGVTGVGAWDLKFAQAATQATERAHAAQAGIDAHGCMQALCEDSELILSAVTASATLAVAQEAAAFIRPGTIFLDLNSASPGTKQQAATLIEAAGGHYVEAGVMTSVPPYGIKVPMLLGGRAGRARRALTGLGHGRESRQRPAWRGQCHQDVPQRDDQGTGGAGHRKLQPPRVPMAWKTRCCPRCRRPSPASTGARRAPIFSAAWRSMASAAPKKCANRRNTVREAGFEPFMAAAIAEKQQWMADQAKAGVLAGVPKGAPWQDFADALLAARKP